MTLACSPIDLVDLTLREYCWLRCEDALLPFAVAIIGHWKIHEVEPTQLLIGGKFKSLLPQWSKMTALTEWWKQAVGKRNSKPKSVDKTDWTVHWCILNLKLSSWTAVNLLLVSLPLAERVVALVILSSSLMTQLAFIPAATHLIEMEGAFLIIWLSTVFLTLPHTATLYTGTKLQYGWIEHCTGNRLEGAIGCPA